MPSEIADWPALAIMAAFAGVLLKLVQSVLAFYQERLANSLDSIAATLDKIEERTRQCPARTKPTNQ